MIQRRDQTIKRALEVAREQCQGDADAYLSRLLRTLDGTLGDALAFCWGTIRQVERCANVPTLSTPRDFGLHHVEEHLLFTAANDALSHLDLVERLLEEVKSFCQQDVTPHLDALSNACPTSFRDRLRETRNLLAAHRDERVLYRRLTGEHTARAINAYLRLGIEVPEGSMDSEIIAFSPPPGASDEEAAEGASRVGQIGGGIAHLGEITQRMGQLDEALSSLRQNLSQPKQSQQDRRHSPARRVHFPGRTDALRVSESLRDSEVGFPAASRNSPA